MHGDVHGIGLAIVVGGSRVEGFHCGGFALVLVLGAVDPHFCGAGLIDRDLTVTTVLVPVLGGDDEAEIGEFAIEVERRHLAQQSVPVNGWFVAVISVPSVEVPHTYTPRWSSAFAGL